MRTLLTLSLLLVAGAFAAPLRAAEVRSEEGGRRIVLENTFLRATILPGSGGKIASLVDLAAGRELAGGKPESFASGLGKVRFLGPPEWEFCELPCTAATERLPDGSVSVTLTARGKTPPFDRLEVIRRCTLREGRAALDIAVTLRNTNPLAGPITVVPWFHQLLHVPANAAEATTFFVPSHASALATRFPKGSLQEVVVPAAGRWLGMVDASASLGVVAACREAPAYLYQWLSGDAGSLEWLYPEVKLADRWEASYSLLVPRGLRAIAAAGQDAVIACRAGTSWPDPGRHLPLLSLWTPQAGTPTASLEAPDGTKTAVLLPAATPGRAVEASPELAMDRASGAYRLRVGGADLPLFAGKQPPAGPEPLKGFTALLTAMQEQKESALGPVVVRHWVERATLSPDFLYPLFFGMRSPGPGKGALPRAVFDIPEEIELVSHCAGYWWYLDEKMDLVDKSPVTHDGKRYTRYRFDTAMKVYGMMWIDHLRLLLRPKVNSGELAIYYGGEWQGRLGPLQRLPVSIIRAEPAETPRRFRTGMEVDQVLIRNTPGFAAELRRLGFNEAVLNYNLITVEPKSAEKRDDVRRFVQDLRGQGLFVSVMGAGYLDPGLPEEAKAVDRDGKPTRWFDFTYRDSVPQAVDRLAQAADWGFDWIISDWEPYFSGEQVSFTERTRTAFAAWLAGKHPEIPFVDPHDVVKDPAKYAAQEKAWVQFKCEQVADYIRQVQAGLKERHPNAKLGWCTIAGESEERIRRDNLQDHALLGTFLDAHQPMLYNNVYKSMPAAGRTADMLFRWAGPRCQFVATLCPGYPNQSDGFWDSPVEDNKHIILEVATSGARGYWLWPGFQGTTGEDLRAIAQANGMIAACEDVLLDGKREDSLARGVTARNTRLGVSTALHPKVIRHADGRIVLFFSEYSRDDIEVALRLGETGIYRVQDLESGEACGLLTRERPVLRTTLTGSGRVRLYLLVPARPGEKAPEGKTTRVTAPEAGDEASAAGRLSFTAADGRIVMKAAEWQAAVDPAGALHLSLTGGEERALFASLGPGPVTIRVNGKETDLKAGPGESARVGEDGESIVASRSFTGEGATVAVETRYRFAAGEQSFSAEATLRNAGAEPVDVALFGLGTVPHRAVDYVSIAGAKGPVAKDVALAPSPSLHGELLPDGALRFGCRAAGWQVALSSPDRLPLSYAFISVADNYYLQRLYYTWKCFDQEKKPRVLPPGEAVTLRVKVQVSR